MRDEMWREPKFMKKIILILFILIIISCGKEKTEFIKSNVYPHLFLLKNFPNEDSLVKNDIIQFLLKNPPKKEDYSTRFYKQNSNTKYFIDNKEDPGGFSSEEISMYDDEAKLATFFISICKKDTTKVIGELYFYGVNFNQIDTLIYKCK